MSKVWKGSQPSNIALIKYMGKKPGGKNLPTNASLSWTLKHLTTAVELEVSSNDDWQLLQSPYPFQMSDHGKSRYLSHLQKLKEHFGIQENFIVRSGNNFPADCGIASSASSFAALTEVACNAFSEISGKEISQQERAFLSSKGSGSSCRSFFEGWVRWDGDKTEAMDLGLGDLRHMVILAGEKKKTVSSSKAHQIVSTSPLFDGRVPRVEKRMVDFVAAAKAMDWPQLYQVAWEEFWDMHALFETSRPHFGYFEPNTVKVLSEIREFWNAKGDGPLVTMDAGPNIHLLWRDNQVALATEYFETRIQDQITCLSDIENIGFAKVEKS